MRKQTMRASANKFVVEATRPGQKKIDEDYFTLTGARMRVMELTSNGWSASWRRKHDEPE